MIATKKTEQQHQEAKGKARVFGFLLATLVAAGTLVLVGTEPAEAAFPGANGKIAFESNRDGNDEIYSMKPDGSNQRNLTNNSAADYEPAISPDGKKIAFASTRDDIWGDV